ncbi:MAG: ImmA/IrrE family metallo-endopeptidase [Micromonosporaceae bacterium]
MAKRWNKAELGRLAVEIRRVDLGLTEFQRLCPYRLAEEHGVDVYSLADLAEAGCPQEAIDYFTKMQPGVWSAALVPNGTGQFIVENPVHTPRRRRSNLAHEMAHLLLEHEFDRILFTDGKRGCRNPSTKQMEQEAAELSGELLLPAAAARRAAVRKISDEEVADLYDVSVEFARWRLNATGARLIAQRAAQKRA